jgi:hypothetical protein
MANSITWVGLDAHKESIQVAMLIPGKGEPLEWQLANEPQAVRHLWSCPDLTHTQISWQACRREVGGGQAAAIHA